MATFKIGDKVRVISGTYRGMTATITDTDSTSIPYHARLDNPAGRPADSRPDPWFREAVLELIPVGPFKVGDKITPTLTLHGLTPGKVYEVVALDHDGDPKVRDDSGDLSAHFARIFKAAPPPPETKFKVGDKVRFLPTIPASWWFKAGQTAVVSKVGNESYTVQVDPMYRTRGDTHGYGLRDDQMELVPRRFKVGDIVKFKATGAALACLKMWFPGYGPQDRHFVETVATDGTVKLSSGGWAATSFLILAARPQAACPAATPKEDLKVYFVGRDGAPTRHGYGICPRGPFTKAEAVAEVESNAARFSRRDCKYVIFKLAAEVSVQTTTKAVVKEITP